MKHLRILVSQAVGEAFFSSGRVKMKKVVPMLPDVHGVYC